MQYIFYDNVLSIYNDETLMLTNYIWSTLKANLLDGSISHT